MGEIKVLDVVALMEDLPAEGLRRGEVGTVVELKEKGFPGPDLSHDALAQI